MPCLQVQDQIIQLIRHIPNPTPQADDEYTKLEYTQYAVKNQIVLLFQLPSQENVFTYFFLFSYGK